MACVENGTGFEILGVEDSDENRDEVEAEDCIEDYVQVEKKDCGEESEILKVEDTKEFREKSDIKDENAEIENDVEDFEQWEVLSRKDCEKSEIANTVEDLHKSEIEDSIEDYGQSEVKNRKECEEMEVEDFIEDFKRLEVTDRKDCEKSDIANTIEDFHKSEIEDSIEDYGQSEVKNRKECEEMEVEDFMEDFKRLEVTDRKDCEKSDIEESKKDYKKLKDNILIMNNIECIMFELFIWMENEFKQLKENEYIVHGCKVLNKLLGEIIKEFKSFKLHHQSFVENFMEMNKYSIYENKELFVFNFSVAIDNFISFNSIEKSLRQLSFKDVSQFPYEYDKFKTWYWEFFDYFFRIKQCCLPFKEHFNKEKILKIAFLNCCGLEDKEFEFVRYMNKEDLDIFLLQGTHFNNFDCPCYFVFQNSGEKVLALLNKDVCRNPEEVEYTNSFGDEITNYQILKLPLRECELTIANIYNCYSLNQNFDITRLPPFLSENSLVLGDFSAFSKNWSDHFTNSIGENVEEFLRISDFLLLNNFISTSDEKFGNRIMDLALCSVSLMPYVTWEVNECNFSNGRRIIRMYIDLKSLNGENT